MEVTTEPYDQYLFYPIFSGCVNFKVRASNNVHIALAKGPAVSDSILEVVIGDWGNTRSVVRRVSNSDKVVEPHRNVSYAEVNTKGILNEKEFRGFWVRWSGGWISAGRENEYDPFISWNNPEPYIIRHVGVCTAFGASGIWKIEGRYDVNTPDKLEYAFYPVISGELEFEFKGSRECHVALTNGDNLSDPMYEVILGGYDNRESAITYCQESVEKVTAKTEFILDTDVYRKFLIQWTSGRIVVRSGIVFWPVIMEWTDENPFPITHFGICTPDGGSWKILRKYVPQERGLSHVDIPDLIYKIKNVLYEVPDKNAKSVNCNINIFLKQNGEINNVEINKAL